MAAKKQTSKYPKEIYLVIDSYADPNMYTNLADAIANHQDEKGAVEVAVFTFDRMGNAVYTIES